VFQIRWMSYAKYLMAVSVVLTIVGLGAFLTLGLNRGIDFSGGMMVDLKFEQDVTIAQIKEAVKKSIGSEPVVQEAQLKGEAVGREYLIRTPFLDQAAREKLLAELAVDLGKFERVGLEEVSATVSGELTTRATLAVLIGAILQLIYIAFRFQVKFGVAAIVALLHDAIMTIGLMALLRIEVNAPFVAAILTVVGYSINDTIVLFDRIRENLTLRKKGESYAEMIDKSINQVLARTVWTTLTVLFMTISLLVLGGDTTFAFAAALSIGIVVGTYSTIFIASPVWLWWTEADRKKKATAPASPAKA
jgi:preprotein translocase subunit SecF